MDYEKAFEWLLHVLDYKRIAANRWEHRDGTVYHISDLVTYDFISQIEIEDWELYLSHLLNLVPDTFVLGEFIHNASLDHRILALALSRGYHE